MHGSCSEPLESEGEAAFENGHNELRAVRRNRRFEVLNGEECMVAI